VALGFTEQQLEPYAASHITFSLQPVDLRRFVNEAHVCVSYGAEATVMSFLMAGVPQVFSPYHVEAHLAARRIGAMGIGIVLKGSEPPAEVAQVIESVVSQPGYRRSAAAFQARHPAHDGAKSILRVAEAVEDVVAPRSRVAVA
jgi:UDP:flavonoid glycosyltransferase YjiC (YdhE family)